MSNVNWFGDNDISRSLNKNKPEKVDLSKLPWAELRAQAKDKGVDLNKYRLRVDIEAQLRGD